MDYDSDEDRKERDAFSERVKERDKEHTRKVASRSGTWQLHLVLISFLYPLQNVINFLDKSAYEEAAKRLKLQTEKDRGRLIPKLRIESRRQYLKKRKEDKVTELEQDLRDDEFLFEEDE